MEVTNVNISQPIVLGNIYRTPRDRNDDIKKFLDEYCKTLAKISDTRRDIVLVGDFNLDLLKINSRNIFSEYLDSMLSLSLSPVITLPTRFSKCRATLIDHIFCKTSNLSYQCQGGIMLKHLSDHYPAFIAIKNKATHNHPPKHVTIQNTSPHASARFIAEVSSENFSALLDSNVHNDPTPNLEVLNSVLTKAHKKHIAPKTVKFRRYTHKIKSWMTNGLLKSIKYKDTLYKRLHSMNPDTDEYSSAKINLQTFSRILNRLIRQAKLNHYNNLFTKYKNDCKKTWETLNTIMNISKNACQFPSFFVINNQEISCKEAIARNFNEYFANIGPALASKIETSNGHDFKKYLLNPAQHQFAFKAITETDIVNLIKEFRPKSSTDSEGLSMKTLKLVSFKLAYPLMIIVNQSLNSGIFPQSLKLAKIKPLLKKDDNTVINNYRPISLLPTISKIVEKVVHKQIVSYLNKHSFLFAGQHGFRNSHSTETATLEFIDKVFKHLDNDKTPISIFLDLSKAFDTLNHNILLQKLSYYGIQNSALTWFESYLTNRYQYVEYLTCV